MPTFDFRSGTASSVMISPANPSGMISVPGPGPVTFTWSANATQTGTGTPVAGGDGDFGHFPSRTFAGATPLTASGFLSPNSFGILTGKYTSLPSNYDLDLVLDATGTGPSGPLTQFGGQVTVNVQSLAANNVGTTLTDAQWDIIFHTKSGIGASFTDVGAGTVSANGQFTHITFSFSGGAFSSIVVDRLIADSINCFCAGTLIETPDGPVAVEALSAGERVVLQDGREAEIVWLGRQHIDPSLDHPRKVNPIRITAGALGDGLPTRDLRLSPDHAIHIDGLLINAGALVNGTTIYQERKTPPEGFTYYHIETDAHDLILAEGVGAETFIDYATRDTFENADEAPDRIISEMPLPRISSPRLVPGDIKDRLSPRIAAE